MIRRLLDHLDSHPSVPMLECTFSSLFFYVRALMTFHDIPTLCCYTRIYRFFFFLFSIFFFLRMRHCLQSPGILSPLRCLSALTQAALLRRLLRRSLPRGPLSQKVGEVHSFPSLNHSSSICNKMIHLFTQQSLSSQRRGPFSLAPRFPFSLNRSLPRCPSPMLQPPFRLRPSSSSLFRLQFCL